MPLTTDALIIRENNNIGEADRFITALTREKGVVRASARGARNLKNRHASATQLLCYSRLSLIEGRDKYIIEDARPLRVFFELRQDIGRLALAQYFCELAGVLAPRDEPAEADLRLMLNALHYVAQGRDPRQIKAVTELRMLTLAGFMPDLTACTGCGAAEGAPMWLLPGEGVLLCGTCAGQGGRPLPDGAIPLDATVLAAMRHIVYAAFDRLFAFTVPETAAAALAQASERYLLHQLGRSFRTLDFYHTVC